MAYWQIQHGTDHRRALLSAPATYQDLVSALLLSRGKDPADLASQEAAEGPKKRPRHFRPGLTPVTVQGGQKTPQNVQMARQWGQANLPRDWARRTGANPEAIAWALKKD